MTRLAVTLAVLLAASTAADEHLLAGARSFRSGEYAQALVEFRVAEKLAHGGEAAWYAAATLQKLGRAEEAVEAFARAGKTAPAAHDALLDYYRAMACYDARLYECADRLLANVGDSPGPRIAQQAAKARGYIAVLAQEPPTDANVAWYRARESEARAAGQQELAAAYAAEAAALELRRSRTAGKRGG